MTTADLHLNCVKRPDGMYYVTSPKYPLHIVDPERDEALRVARYVVRTYQEQAAMTDITTDDIDVLTRTIFGEARSETQQGREAVGHVVMNRLRAKANADGKRFGATIAEVCSQRWQFSCWNGDGANHRTLEAATVADRVFRECMITALTAIDARDDPTFGSTHYKVIGSPANWAAGRVPVVSIGHHEFFVGIA